jgi:hypothetical protein
VSVLSQVFASGTGNRRHPLFFLDGLRRRLCGSQPRQPRASSELQLPTIKSNSAAVKVTIELQTRITVA